MFCYPASRRAELKELGSLCLLRSVPCRGLFGRLARAWTSLVSGLFAESLHLERKTVVFDKKSRQNFRRDDVF
jgi:hypothetical protein